MTPRSQPLFTLALRKHQTVFYLSPNQKKMQLLSAEHTSEEVTPHRAGASTLPRPMVCPLYSRSHSSFRKLGFKLLCREGRAARIILQVVQQHNKAQSGTALLFPETWYGMLWQLATSLWAASIPVSMLITSYLHQHLCKKALLLTPHPEPASCAFCTIPSSTCAEAPMRPKKIVHSLVLGRSCRENMP